VLQWEDCYSEAQMLRSNTTYHEGVPEYSGGGGGNPCLVILDDLLNDVYSKHLCDLFTRGSHHRNSSVILITQNQFYQGRYCRDVH